MDPRIREDDDLATSFGVHYKPVGWTPLNHKTKFNFIIHIGCDYLANTMAGIYFFADGDQMVFLGVSFLPLSISFAVSLADVKKSESVPALISMLIGYTP